MPDRHPTGPGGNEGRRGRFRAALLHRRLLPVVVAVLAGALVLPVLVRARELAKRPAFSVGPAPARRAPIVARGIRVALPLQSGTLEIEAEYAEPGHERWGAFELGPSTFFRLHGVVATCRRAGAAMFSVRSPRARLDASDLTLGRSSVQRPGQEAVTLRRVAVDLATGHLR
jgi:hypothetical protein